MAEASVARPGPAPWSLRAFEAVPLAPPWVGILVVATVLSLYFGVEYATGQIDAYREGTAKAHIPMHWRTEVLAALVLGYILTAQLYLERWTTRNLAEIQPLLREEPGTSRSADGATLGSQPSRLAGVVGALVFAVVILGHDLQSFSSPEYWVFEHTWGWIMVPLIGWVTGRVTHAVVSDSMQVSRLASRLERVDLFDLSPLAPFVRQGLRSALLIILYTSVGSLHLVNPGVTWPLLIILSASLPVAIAALVLPVRGVHRRIQDEKRAKLSELRSVVRADERSLLEQSPEAAGAAARLPGLLALETRIEAVREWPFDAPTIARFALYLSLGIGSWIGAAGVERLIDVAFG